MKKIGLLTTLLFCSLILVGCNNIDKSEEFISYYDNGSVKETGMYINGMKQGVWTTYDEGGNVINIEEYKDGGLIVEPDEVDLSVNENEILSIDELKKICEEALKEIEPANPEVTWTEEKLFINTYGFRGNTKSDGIHDGSPTYCNITLDGFVLSNGFYRDQGQTIEQLHDEMDFNNIGGIGNLYPNLKGFYGFVGGIIIGDVLQTNYINWNNTLYYDPYRGIALKLGEDFDGGLIREIDTDEGEYPHSEIIFLVKGEENEENRTGINGYREIFTITAISKQVLEDFKVTPDFINSVIGENNSYYFVESKIDSSDNSINYTDLTIFDVEESVY